jgi:hypothetical protein
MSSSYFTRCNGGWALGIAFSLPGRNTSKDAEIFSLFQGLVKTLHD